MRLDTLFPILLASVKRRGLLTTLRMIASEFWFDWRYHVDTRAILPVEQLQNPKGDITLAEMYQGINPISFYMLLAYIPSPRPHQLFVDFGSGKGRAMMLAALSGYHHLMGIDFAPELCQQAETNLKSFFHSTSLSCQWQIRCEDAATTIIPDEADVLFFYNPFKPPVLCAVLENVQQSLTHCPRTLYIVYAHPMHRELFTCFGYNLIHEILNEGIVLAHHP